jgi:hypothetical protein
MKSAWVMIVVASVVCPVWAAYGGGAGTPQEPYLINTPEQLNAIGANTADYDKYFKLMADLDMSGYDGEEGRPSFNSIGYHNSFSDRAYFSGGFDGNFKTISNLTIPQKTQYMAMFGATTIESIIQNVVLQDVYSVSTLTPAPASSVGGLLGMSYGTVTNCSVSGTVSGSYYVGGLIGYAGSGTILNCTSSATVSGIGHLGGLIGHTYNITVSRCKAEGNVNTTSDSANWAGGFVGLNTLTTISDCAATGHVIGMGADMGGFCGANGNGSLIEKCYSTGNVEGGSDWQTQEIGGFVGSNNEGIIQHCFSTGNVTGYQGIGGFAGVITKSSTGSSTITQCYSAGTVQGQSNVGGFLGASYWASSSTTYSFYDSTKAPIIPAVGYHQAGVVEIYARSTAQMKTQSTFTSYGWDFADVWRMCTDGVKYPNLKAAYLAMGDFVCPDGVLLTDYALFAQKWLANTCDSSNGFCSGTDIDLSGAVDHRDFDLFVLNWLTEL